MHDPLTLLVGELRKFVDVLARVRASRYAKSKFEIEALQELISKVVTLDHAKLFDGLIPNNKFDPEKKQNSQ